MNDRQTLTFSVFGAGNLGCQLIAALTHKGYSLAYVYKKTKNQRYRESIESDITRIVEQSDIVFIAVQESKIRSVAEYIASSSDPSGTFFFHTSNSLTSDELISLKEKGGITASFSPLQTFASPEPADAETCMDNVFFLAEGDPESVRLAERLADHLNANIVPVKKEDKVYLHIAAVSSSNFFIGILKLAERQLKKVNQNIDILLPLVKQTLGNVERNGVEASLTGPVKRGETGIVNKHLSTLEGVDAALYKELSNYLKS